MTTMSDGLRALADLIDEVPELEHHIYDQTFHAYCRADQFVALAQTLSGYEKVYTDDEMMLRKRMNNTDVIDRYQEGGITLQVHTAREGICTKTVTGTKTVEVPDYSQTPTITKEVEIVEWECSPLLAR